MNPEGAQRTMYTPIEDWFAENEPASLSTLAPCFQESRLFALRKIASQAAIASQDATKTKERQDQFKDLTMLCKSVSRGLAGMPEREQFGAIRTVYRCCSHLGMQLDREPRA